MIRRPGAKALGSTASEKSSGGKGKWIAAVLILLLLAAGAWAFLPRKNVHVARIEELRAQLETAPREQRRELFDQMREEFRQLPESEREAMFADRRKQWEAREQKRYDEFFALSPAERIAYLDKEIDEDERERKERAERRARQGNQQRGDRGGRGGWGGRGGGDRNSMERRKGYLDNTNPVTRAQRGEYRRAREERRRQRGLS
jgi:uncharacterized protein HemX